VTGPFRWLSPVFFDEFDPNGTLHNSRHAVHIERAQSALFEQLGKDRSAITGRDDDLVYLVRELHIEYLAPVAAPGAILIELAAGTLGRTSATYLFRCADPAGETTFARGHRVIVKIGPDGRPAPWSAWYRDAFRALAPDGSPAPDGLPVPPDPASDAAQGTPE
jgi:acyl-CoA thioester hydrolase